MAQESRQAWIDAVRQAVDITEVVGRHVALQKKGRHWWGLCPFHAEKTPSFSVDPDQQLFYCFGCHEGGTVFTFLMRLEGREFLDVVQALGDEVGIARPESGARDDGTRRLRAVMEWTQEYFTEQFQRHEGKVLAYLKGRGVDIQIAEKFMLGYAPDGWHGLKDVLERRGVSLQEMVLAGVVIAREQGGGYDRWRQRLMFPILDLEGRIVAFGGRALDSGQEPKYLNSPDTPLFKKGNLLYAAHLARPSWRKGTAALLVEGYFDVLACHQAQLGQAAAQLGTALTDHHARLLARYCSEVDLLLDQDEAGREAMRRAFLTLSKAGLRTNVVTLPNGIKDPSEMVEAKGEDALRQQMHQKRPYVQAVIEAMSSDPSVSSPRGQAIMVEQLKPVLNALTDPVEKAGYIEVAARALRVHPKILTQSFGSAQGIQHTIGKNRHNMVMGESARRSLLPAEIRLLATLRNHLEEISRVQAALPGWSQQKAVRSVLEAMLEGHMPTPGQWSDAFEDADVERLWTAIWQDTEPDGGNAAINQLIEALQNQEAERRWRALRERVRQGDTTPEVLDEIRRLSGTIGHSHGRKEG